MPQIAAAPIILRDVILTLGATDTYEAHVSRVQLTPQSTTVRWQGLTPSAKFAKQTEPEWTLDIAGVQDWETANSLALFLTDNHGDEVAFSFAPVNGSGPEWSGTLIAQAVPVGGDVNTIPAFTASLGVVGQPTKAPQV